MKKTVLLVLSCLMTLTTIMAQEPSACRDSKSIKKFINSLPKEIKNCKSGPTTTDPLTIEQSYFMPMAQNVMLSFKLLGMIQVSLNDVDRNLLNDVEKELLDKYFDVWILNKHCAGYLTVDDNLNVGFATFQGKILLEPCFGTYILPSLDGSVIAFGNTARAIDCDYRKGIGNFQAVVDVTNEKVIIEPGTYDYLGVFMFGTSAKNQDQKYLFGMRQPNGKILFGLLDRNGQEEKPCIYTGIIMTDIVERTFYYSMTETSDEILNTMRLRYEEQQQRQAQIDAMIQSLATSAIEITQAVTGSMSETGSSTTSTSKAPSTQNSSKQYTNPEGYQEARRAYLAWEDQVRKMKNGLTEYNQSNLRYMQQNMKNIRTRWEAKGHDFYKSELETWQ